MDVESCHLGGADELPRWSLARPPLSHTFHVGMIRSSALQEPPSL
jgi:hypothetical protein